MHKTLIVHLHDITLNSVSWVLHNGADEAVSDVQIGNLQDLSTVIGSHKVVLIIPSTNITYSTVQLPVTDRERMIRALPYAMEDHIIENVENIHFSINSWKNNQADISAISHQQLENLLERLNNSGISPDYVIPDIFFLPFSENNWTILLLENYAVIRTGRFSGFSANNFNLQQILEINLTQAEIKPGAITLISKAGRDDFDKNTFIEKYPDLSISHSVLKNDYIELFSKSITENLSYSLLQGIYSKHEQLENIWHSWRPVAILASIVLLLYTFSLTTSVYKLNNSLASVDKQITDVFKKTLPGVKKIVNPKAQLQHELNKLSKNSSDSNSGFLALLAKSATSISTNKNIKLNSMTYKDQTLDMELVIDNFQNLDVLKTKIEENDVITEILSASADGTSVLGRLRLSGNNLSGN